MLSVGQAVGRGEDLLTGISRGGKVVPGAGI
jgi:hypothetical protein